MFFPSTFQNIRRTREIIAVLVKYGFEDLVANTTLRNFVTERMRLSWVRQEKPVLEYTRWERIRMAAEELGPTFVKLAQVLSNRPDLLPEGLIKELEKLQDKVPPFEFSLVRETIETELGKDLEEIFEDFEETPLASASIGQVHRAKLKTGEEVVVKVQRPKVRELVYQDLAILKEVVDRTERYLERQGIINAKDVILAFERTMHKEMDYNNEARNIERFRNFYKEYKNFYIPKAYRHLTTEKVLVIEYVYGCKITDVAQMKAWGLDPKKIAENGMSIYLTQIFQYGYFHADPHPGNVMVRRDGVIILIDFGMIGQLMRKDKYAFARIFISFARQDATQMALNMKKLALDDQIQDMRQFIYDLNEIIEDFALLDISESNIADMISRLQKIMYDYKIRVPGGIFLIFRAFAILEGIGKQIHPTFNTYEFIKPYGMILLREEFSPQNIWNEIQNRSSELSAFLNSFPADIKDIVHKLRQGKLHIEIEHQGYGYLLKKLDSITNRISITLIIVALIIGSSIAMTVNFPDQWMTSYGIPYISMFGLLAAGFLLLLLFYAILRRRKYK